MNRPAGGVAVEGEPDKDSAFTVYLPQIAGEIETDAIRDDEILTGAEQARLQVSRDNR